uniref:Uncharacterized protein n=1 Tax=Oryza brachyantha TaxID=4533 RepID=J3M0K2_ORYBR
MEWAYYGSGYSSSGTPSPVGGDGDEDSYMTVSSAPPKRRAGRTKFKETRHPVYKGVRSRNPGRVESSCTVDEVSRRRPSLNLIDQMHRNQQKKTSAVECRLYLHVT